MKNDDTTEIVRLVDGCIDYDYYVAKASIARNGAIKQLAGKLLETPAARGPGISALVTVVLLAIIF